MTRQREKIHSNDKGLTMPNEPVIMLDKEFYKKHLRKLRKCLWSRLAK